jgi:hypothetical protein
VTPNGTPQFTLFLDNTGFAGNVTVTVVGKDATGAQVSSLTVPTSPVFVPSGVVGQQLTIPSGVTVDPSVKTWQISGINVTQ